MRVENAHGRWIGIVDVDKNKHPKKRMRRFVIHVSLSVGIVALLSVRAMGVESSGSGGAVDTLFPEPAVTAPPAQAKPAVAASNSAATLAEINRRLSVIEARLGPTARPSSIGYNIERRLADLERRVQQLEQKQTRMLQWEQRIRRMEMK
jgi:hypothetical protein